MNRFNNIGLIGVIFLSWGIALFEYMAQVPANRIGFTDNGGPFNLWQLKVIQEVVGLTVFSMFTVILFKGETFRINHAVGFLFLILAIFYFQEIIGRNLFLKPRSFRIFAQAAMLCFNRIFI